MRNGATPNLINVGGVWHRALSEYGALTSGWPLEEMSGSASIPTRVWYRTRLNTVHKISLSKLLAGPSSKLMGLPFCQSTGYGPTWLRHLLWEQAITGSNPVIPTLQGQKLFSRRALGSQRCPCNTWGISVGKRSSTTFPRLS